MKAAQVLAGYSLGRGRPSAPRDGQEDPVGNECPARALRLGRGGQRHRPGQGVRIVRLDRQVRRLWLQQEPRRGLCAGRLSHRLAEGASPARILRRVDELRHGPDRQAGLVRRGHPPRRGRMPAAVRQRQPRRFLGRGRQGSLRVGRAEGRRRESDGVAGRRARRQRPVHQPRRFRRADRPAAAQPPPDRKPCRGGRVRLLLARSRRAVRRRRDHPRPRRQRRRAAVERAGRAVRRGRATPGSPRSACRATPIGRWPSA